jgi:predicted mannosyl-3-phosphoglycerate phosphatase (HAD superfamily)
MKAMLTQSDLRSITNIIKTEINSVLKPINKKLRKIESKLDLAIDYFDTKTLNHEKRINRVESHLHLSPLSS